MKCRDEKFNRRSIRFNGLCHDSYHIGVDSPFHRGVAILIQLFYYAPISNSLNEDEDKLRNIYTKVRVRLAFSESRICWPADATSTVDYESSF